MITLNKFKEVAKAVGRGLTVAKLSPEQCEIIAKAIAIDLDVSCPTSYGSGPMRDVAKANLILNECYSKG